MTRPKPTYPPEWKAVSAALRHDRAQHQCECTGECGLHRTHPGPRRCIERDGQPAVWARGIVVLTVAHLCTCEPLCAEPSHLKAMCNRCHLRVDQPLHQRHTAETRRLQREAAGQLSLLGAGCGAAHTERKETLRLSEETTDDNAPVAAQDAREATFGPGRMEGVAGQANHAEEQ